MLSAVHCEEMCGTGVDLLYYSFLNCFIPVSCFTFAPVDFHNSVFYKIPNNKCLTLQLFSVMMFCV